MTRKVTLWERLYSGNGAFDIIGKRRRLYVIFALLLLVCIGSVVFRGFNLGIDFEGGTKVSMRAQGAQGTIQTEAVEDVFRDTMGTDPATVQSVGAGDSATIQIKTETLSPAEVTQLKDALFEEFQPFDSDGEPNRAAINDSAVSASWGGEVSKQAMIALGVFLILVTIFLVSYFERWMALSAIATLLHDVLITVGVYSLVGFEVTPSSVIGLLTILGYSLYDTVVVFDKVRENTRGLLGLTRRTYGEAANLAVNQTIIRSVNTTVSSVLPVAGLLIIGAGLLGAGTLKDLALVMMVGLLAGTVSSIFVATPVLVELKMRERKYRDQAARVKARRDNLARKAAERDKAAGAAGAAGGDEDTTAEAAGGDSDPDPDADDIDVSDDEALEAELRHEKALAAASSVPTRTPKSSDTRRGKATGKSGRPASKARAQPRGKKRR